MNRRRLPLVAALGLALALGGCSMLSFAYGRVDLLAEHYADRWFDFDAGQSSRFRSRVRERMVVNRREELPQAAALLDEAVRLVGGRPAPAEVDALFDRGRGLFEQALRRSLPLMSDTLAELAPTQVGHFARELAESNAEQLEEDLDVDPVERQAERRKELRLEIERWTGKLEPAQRAILDRLVEQVPDGSRAWFEHRQVRQRGLLALMRSRADAPAYARFIEEWWLGDRHLDPAHAERLERGRRSTADAMAELIASLTPRQRERASARLGSIARELEALHRAGQPREAGAG